MSREGTTRPLENRGLLTLTIGKGGLNTGGRAMAKSRDSRKDNEKKKKSSKTIKEKRAEKKAQKTPKGKMP